MFIHDVKKKEKKKKKGIVPNSTFHQPNVKGQQQESKERYQKTSNTSGHDARLHTRASYHPHVHCTKSRQKQQQGDPPLTLPPLKTTKKDVSDMGKNDEGGVPSLGHVPIHLRGRGRIRHLPRRIRLLLVLALGGRLANVASLALVALGLDELLDDGDGRVGPARLGGQDLGALVDDEDAADGALCVAGLGEAEGADERGGGVAEEGVGQVLLGLEGGVGAGGVGREAVDGEAGGGEGGVGVAEEAGLFGAFLFWKKRGRLMIGVGGVGRKVERGSGESWKEGTRGWEGFFLGGGGNSHPGVEALG